MEMNPYLLFKGTCEEAFKFYEQTLGGKIEAMLPNTGSPMENHLPPEWENKIMHARMKVNGQVLMASDAPPGRQEDFGGFSLSLNVGNEAEAERVFAALANGGSVRMPIQETFWAKRFGMLVDQFGVPWMVNCEKPR